jgi:hypothetical protein
MLVIIRNAQDSRHPDREAEFIIGPLPASAAGQTIRVAILRAAGARVTVGIDAPAVIPIVRSELLGSGRGIGPSGEALERRAREGGYDR